MGNPSLIPPPKGEGCLQATLKRECVNQWILDSRRQAKSEVFKYIEMVYNLQTFTLHYRVSILFGV